MVNCLKIENAFLKIRKFHNWFVPRLDNCRNQIPPLPPLWIGTGFKLGAMYWGWEIVRFKYPHPLYLNLDRGGKILYTYVLVLPKYWIQLPPPPWIPIYTYIQTYTVVIALSALRSCRALKNSMRFFNQRFHWKTLLHIPHHPQGWGWRGTGFFRTTRTGLLLLPYSSAV